jgi:hypothetical protein
MIGRFLLFLFFAGTIRRIKPAMVKTAQKITKLHTYRNGFFSESGKAACPLSILTWAKLNRDGLPTPKFYTSERVIDTLRLDENYVLGFMAGFDNRFLRKISGQSPHEYGRIDGARCRERLMNIKTDWI